MKKDVQCVNLWTPHTSSNTSLHSHTHIHTPTQMYTYNTHERNMLQADMITQGNEGLDTKRKSSCHVSLDPFYCDTEQHRLTIMAIFWHKMSIPNPSIQKPRCPKAGNFLRESWCSKRKIPYLTSYDRPHSNASKNVEQELERWLCG